MKLIRLILLLSLTCTSVLFAQPEPEGETKKETTKQPSFEELISDLKTDNSVKRILAAKQLRIIEVDEDKLKEVAPVLLQSLKEEKAEETKAAIIETLGVLKVTESIEPILAFALSKEGSDKFRIMAMRSLVTIGDSSFCKKLAPLFFDEKEEIATYAVWAVTSFALDEYIDDLLKALAGSKPIVRKEILRYIGSANDERVIPAIAKITKDEDEEIAISAIKALQGIEKTEEVEKILLDGLNDKRQKIKIVVLKALANFESEKAIQAIIKTYNEEKDEIKQTALSLLAQISDKRVLPILKEAVEEKDISIKAIALQGIIALKDPENLPILLKAFKDENPNIHMLALQGILSSEDPSIEPVLCEELEKADPRIKIAIIKKLEKIGKENTIKKLKELADKEQVEEIKEALQKAAKKIKKKLSSPPKEQPKEE